ncbi:hypothetical protein V1525DRAFT_441174 [Lipomyces kononenkoae]|uniref:Uncharacterized protein n=1 Tax=Lipomyces kononenkoae TaxID=34357 RepID=A0ACC3T339_LIPKO
MAGSLVARKRNIQCRTKMKTGCATCRIRKVKCDENKPFCRKCVDTGRTCDGYESPFRFFTSQSINNAHAGGIMSGAGLQPLLPTWTEIAPPDIDLLNRYFSTKTMFDVKLGCDEEARQVLQASLTDPPIRHAVSSLRALREQLETSGDVAASVAQQTPSYGYDYGLQQYCMALGGLASNLSSPGSNGLNSALLCCQVFISIEQVRGNYAAMAQHIIQGLSIMHEYRARPNFVAANKLVPAHHDQLPLLDVFIIKLFAAPCKFADSPATADISRTTVSVCSMSPQTVESRNLRTIAPDMRTELTRIAASTLEFLGKVSHVESAGNALRLLSEKASLLDSLESWLIDLELVHTDIRPPGPELLSVSFLRLFHQILKIVLLGALDSSPNAELRTENDRLQGVASNVEERVKAYRTCMAQSFPATHLIPVLSQSMESADFIASKTFLTCATCLGLHSDALGHGLIEKLGRICKLLADLAPIDWQRTHHPVRSALWRVLGRAGISLTLALCAKLSPIQDDGVRTGTFFTMSAFAGLTGFPIGGTIISSGGGSFTIAIAFGGAACALGRCIRGRPDRLCRLEAGRQHPAHCHFFDSHCGGVWELLLF